MAEEQSRSSGSHLHIQGNLIAGVLTILPLVVVWIVFDFLLTTLSKAGLPIVALLTGLVDAAFPGAQYWTHNPIVQWCISVIVALLLLYAIGSVASRVAGLKLIQYYERLIERIPLVQSVYSATKKLIAALRQQPDNGSRVVMMDFPYPGARAIGFLMRTFKDGNTGEDLAAVYVPTAPNPTSGYLEIVTASRLVSVDMTMDQAMTMILSGGATAPDEILTTPLKRPPAGNDAR